MSLPAGGPIQGAIDDIPAEFRDRFEGLLAADAVPHDALRIELAAYLATVERVGEIVKRLDLGTAKALAHTALALLDHLTADSTAEERRLVQGVVHYFIYEEDDDEITAVLSFEDDIQVMNAASRQLGRPDLVIRPTK